MATLCDRSVIDIVVGLWRKPHNDHTVSDERLRPAIGSTGWKPVPFQEIGGRPSVRASSVRLWELCPRSAGSIDARVPEGVGSRPFRARDLFASDYPGRCPGL